MRMRRATTMRGSATSADVGAAGMASRCSVRCARSWCVVCSAPWRHAASVPTRVKTSRKTRWCACASNVSSFRGESRFTTWAMAIATRIAFDELRHKRWQDVSYEAASADARGPIAFEPSPDVLPDRQLLRERVLAELRVVLDTKLTDKQRGVLVAELGGMPQAEIAHHLGMERNAVYKLSHDARKRAKTSPRERRDLRGRRALGVRMRGHHVAH